MYLVNVDTLELEQFQERDIPPYAILSHRWGEAELTFKEISKRRMNTQSNGYCKLQNTCRIVANYHHLQYLWIDTCCIDKKSSAELSEAINSMYKWYQNAVVCIAYLRDVVHEHISKAPNGFYAAHAAIVSFEQSEWFTRSWTLQELLAPENLHFYDGHWQKIGTKLSLVNRIAKITNIPEEVLSKLTELADYPVAQKMSWASNRDATREEDLSYSLLGIFDVNMPLLYGECKKAFQRLQEEIIRTSTDYSFLFWGLDSKDTRLLAECPAEFPKDSAEIPPSRTGKSFFVMNNVGLEIELPLIWWDLYIYACPTAQNQRNLSRQHTPYLLLLKLDLDTGYFYRIDYVHNSGEFRYTLENPKLRKVLLVRKPGNVPQPIHQTFSGFRQIPGHAPIEPIISRSYKGLPRGIWDAHADTGQFQCRFSSFRLRCLAHYTCQVSRDTNLHISMTFNHQFLPCIIIAKSPPAQDLLRSKNIQLDDLLLRFVDNKDFKWEKVQLRIICAKIPLDDEWIWLLKPTDTKGFVADVPQALLPRGTWCMIHLSSFVVEKGEHVGGKGYFDFFIKHGSE